GTKGKGSTAVMIAEILNASGYRVGLFTSPHIERFEERMTVGGVSPTPEQLVELVNSVADAVTVLDRSPGKMNPTYFEIATAMAWTFFRQQRVSVVVLEVGLGGRLDSTNLCQPEVTAITSISRDHTNLLGSRLEQIAFEKAGIIKRGVPVVSGAKDPAAAAVLTAVCRDRDAQLFQLGRELRYRFLDTGVPDALREDNSIESPMLVDVETPWRNWPAVPVPLMGEHQAQNAAVAIGVIDVLNSRGREVAPLAVYEGMKSVRWPLRVEVLSRKPTIIVDAAHNWASVRALLDTLARQFVAQRKILVFATTKDKDVPGILRQLLPNFDTVIVTQYLNNPRAVPYQELKRIVESISEYPVHLAPDPSSAWKLLARFLREEDLVCITGSFFIAAEMREVVLDYQTGQSLENSASLR
ncbi:MAG: bifunctional folylpolyglutamate synthase/dihydrofolate synthase, partial [Gammaproteobacteria bacterium]|nr:bifunctional folylpolyglutamate synthase/dihydrofolate synthase [Gammaproteobacteria bacterium]